MGNKRIAFESGYFYHVYNHGNGSEKIFRCTDNYYYFLKKFALYIHPIVDAYAYCLMPNHFHFLIKIKDEEEISKLVKIPKKIQHELQDPAVFSLFISRTFGNFLNAYAKAFNRMYERKGSLFLDNIKRKKIGSENYLTKVIHYIHYNPIQHGFVKKIHQWPFTSYSAHISSLSTRLKRDEVITWFGGIDAYKEFHRSEPKNKPDM